MWNKPKNEQIFSITFGAIINKGCAIQLQRKCTHCKSTESIGEVIELGISHKDHPYHTYCASIDQIEELRDVLNKAIEEYEG